MDLGCGIIFFGGLFLCVVWFVKLIGIPGNIDKIAKNKE
jgi:hypothetical protein